MKMNPMRRHGARLGSASKKSFEKAKFPLDKPNNL